jgi:hypothetical protein
VLFATSSSEVPISLPAAFHDYIGKYGPTTMQANSISIPESKALTDAISWINSNTPRESNLVIDKHWRGWVELLLQHRSFTFYENIADLEKLHKNYYLLISDGSRPLFGNEITTAHKIYENVEFAVYEIDSNKKHNEPAKAIVLIS